MIDSAQKNIKITLPLVILKELENKIAIYKGFVPGLDFEYVTSTNLKECESNLRKITAQHIKQMIIDKTKFPFFPEEKEIREDFEGVEKIIFIDLN